MKKLYLLLFFFFFQSNAGIYKAVQLKDSEDRSVYLYFDDHSLNCSEQGYYLYNNILKEYTGDKLNILTESEGVGPNFKITKTIFPTDEMLQQAKLSCLVYLGALINDKRYMRAFNSKNIFITNLREDLTKASILRSILDVTVNSKTAIFAGGDNMDMISSILAENFGYRVICKQEGIFTEDGGGSFAWLFNKNV